MSTLGNWIPRVLSQWYCSGHECGFDQIVIENATGNHDVRNHLKEMGSYFALSYFSMFQ